jgi:hypothetical protein
MFLRKILLLARVFCRLKAGYPSGKKIILLAEK